VTRASLASKKSDVRAMKILEQWQCSLPKETFRSRTHRRQKHILFGFCDRRGGAVADGRSNSSAMRGRCDHLG
jgi:hypothetical protein